MSTIKLQSSDKKIFKIDIKTAICSITIKTMLENLGYEDEDEIIPLPNVKSTILAKIIEWAEYHKDDSILSEDEEIPNHTGIIGLWDREFLKIDQQTLFELITAANYLDIQPLLDITCKTVANMIRGKTTDQIRQIFNIQDDPVNSEEMETEKEVN